MNGDGNFKMRCIDVGNDIYTKGKIYEVINGVWKDDEGDLVGDEYEKTIDDINGRSCATWELVEDEVIESVKEEKTLLEVVMEYLGVTEGEEFNIVWGSGNDSSLSTLNPFMFKDGELLNNYQNSSDNYLGWLITGAYKIEKLKWKPKDGERVWYIFNSKHTEESWCESCTCDSKNTVYVALYKCGWLFRTKKEAEANRERVLAEMKEVMDNE